MQPEEFFRIADAIPKMKAFKSTPEILFRSAINRLYYGTYHMVQREYQILMPASEINRCHAFVKQKIQHLPIKSDYADLEEYRIHADYRIDEPLTKRDLEDAQRIALRLQSAIMGEGGVKYDEKDDEDFFFRIRKS